ncbi:MAG TPA: hypothetical protein VF068_14355, partial [Rubrobacter sp.]
ARSARRGTSREVPAKSLAAELRLGAKGEAAGARGAPAACRVNQKPYLERTNSSCRNRETVLTFTGLAEFCFSLMTQASYQSVERRSRRIPSAEMTAAMDAGLQNICHLNLNRNRGAGDLDPSPTLSAIAPTRTDVRENIESSSIKVDNQYIVNYD